MAHRTAGQPAGALALDLKDNSYAAPCRVSLPKADGDGPAQQKAVPALDMDKLSWIDTLSIDGPGVVQHIPHVQRHGDGVLCQLLLGNHLTFALYFHAFTAFFSLVPPADGKAPFER